MPQDPVDNELDLDVPGTVHLQGKCFLCQHWLLTVPYKDFFSCGTGHSIHEECFIEFRKHSPQCLSLNCGLCDSKYLVGSLYRNMALKMLAIEMIEARNKRSAEAEAAAAAISEAEDQELLAHPVFGPFCYLLHDDTCVV